uniref:Calmodulin-binding transcription activator 1 n=1 Tax=Timema tahoe TaxID=61484 RepID=A0A7R9FGE1_9NEOP|nr:unnamed protein product [Timema tahoe]
MEKKWDKVARHREWFLNDYSSRLQGDITFPEIVFQAVPSTSTQDGIINKPVFSEDEPDLNNELEISTAETVEAIVTQLMEKQRLARAAALTKQLECGCPDSTCADGKTCSHPMRRISAAKTANTTDHTSRQAVVSMTSLSSDNNNQVSSTTGSGSIILAASGNASSNTSTNTANQQQQRLHSHLSHSHNTPATTSAPPLVLSLSQIQGGGGLLILNSSSTASNVSAHQSLVSPVAVTSFVCSTNSSSHHQRNHHHHHHHHPHNNKELAKPIVLKQEAMETNSPASSCCHTSVSDTNTSTSINSLNLSNNNIDNSTKMDITNGNVATVFDTSGSATYSNKSSRDKHTIRSNSTPKQQQHISLSNSSSFIMSSAPPTPTKHMDISGEDVLDIKPTYCSSDTVLVIGSSTGGVNMKNTETISLVGGFFNETLDLSQEDIQRTLSANMPLSCSDELNDNRGRVGMLSGGHIIASKSITASREEMSPEDVIVPEINPMDFIDSCDVVVSPTHVDDDVFVNLDAFDMLGDFPELEILEPSSDDVNANIIESHGRVGGAHEVGLVTLQVACEGFVISNSVIFEYKKPPQEDRSQACSEEKSNDNMLKFTLLQRLEAVDGRLQIKQEPDGGEMVEGSVMFNQNNFEDRMVSYCQHMTSRLWRSGDEVSGSTWFSSLRGMTLLHLAASLGFSRLVCAMLHWRAENSSLLLETEVDALSQDDHGFTPLMWACARGHRETAVLLYHWNHTALNIRNLNAQTATECARVHSHEELAREMERLELHRERESSDLPERSIDLLLPPSSIILTPSLSPAESVVSLASVASTAKSHDGVFLRPGAVTRSETHKYKVLGMELDVSLLDQSTSWSPLFTQELSPSSQQSNVNLQVNQRLSKRPSVDSGIHLEAVQSSDSLPSLRSRSNRLIGGRETPKLSRFDRSMSLPLSSGLESSFDSSSSSEGRDVMRGEVAMGARSSSPIIDVEAVSDEEMLENKTEQSVVGEQEVRVLTLAEQIIAAMPDRIKNESVDMMLGSDSCSQPESSGIIRDTLSEVFMEPLLMDEPTSTFEPVEFNFEFSDHNYRYYDVGSPSSSLSPASSSCLQSPGSFTLDSPSPPPTTADFCEFFQASSSIFEKDFSNLTLSDREQRELYEAAKIIQKAYRSYKGRKKLEEQDKERAAAILIQNYYRRYKQYAYFKQMTRAAMVIQNGFRSYCEHKRFKKSQEAAVCIQNYYRNYREQGGRGSRENTPTTSTSGPLKRTYSQRRQHQAARKIQQFMRQSKNKLQRERALAAERERQSVRLVDVPLKSLCPDNLATEISNRRSSAQTIICVMSTKRGPDS